MIDLSFVHTDLMNVLKKLEKNAVNYASAIATFDGLPLVTAMHNYVDETIVAASSASILALGERTAEEFRHGKLKRVIVEGDNGMTILNSVNDEMFLIVAIQLDQGGII